MHRNLPALYRYYDLRRRKMKLRDIHHYDTYVPILSELDKPHLEAGGKTRHQIAGANGRRLLPRAARRPRNGRWCDRYPNQGKRSGAFSSGSYDGGPYILMNYQPDVLDHVFTLAHEAGHSMHSHYSAKHQPYQYYNYTIFVAEVASTFNEQLLSRHLMEQARKPRKSGPTSINREIDAIRGTIIRQTMFAEFEKIYARPGRSRRAAHRRKAQRGISQTARTTTSAPISCIDEELELECLRIPHFYQAFYVYKYATGLSAAIALAAASSAAAERN